MVDDRALLFHFTAFKMGLAAGVFAFALMLFGTAIGMVVIGIILRFGPGADILAWGLAVILMPISAVFYPVSALPGWAQAISQRCRRLARSKRCGRSSPASRCRGVRSAIALAA